MVDDLGTRLLRAGLVTGAALARCLSSGGRELEHGGRLAVALLEGGLGEDALAGFFLSEGYGPLLGEEALRAPDFSLLESFSSDLADTHGCLPVGQGDHGVVVAMVDPSDEDLVHLLEERLGEAILPAVARWSDVREALARVPLPDEPGPAVIELVRRRTPAGAIEGPRIPVIPAQTFAITDDSPAEPLPGAIESVAPPPEPSPDPDDHLHDADPGRQTQEFGFLALPLERAKPSVEKPRRGIDDWSDMAGSTIAENEPAAPLPSPPSPPPTRQPSARTSRSGMPDIGSQLAEMRSTSDRDLVFRRACEAASTVCKTVIFFVLRDGVLKGWDGFGPDVSRSSIRNLWIPSGSPSVFRDVVVEGDFYLGPHGEAAADRIFRATVNSSGEMLLVLPIAVRGKVVALFACDDVSRDAEGVERMRGIAHATGEALKRIILTRRG